LERLHKKFGSLPWTQLLQPAIKVARYGFPVHQDLVNQMNTATTGAGLPDFLVEDPAWAIDFAPNGTRVGLGDILTRKRYADTLEKIANEGPDVFYTGDIAQATVRRALQQANGTMTLEDLQNYTTAICKPAQITYRGFILTSCSAPSGGIVALSALKTASEYPDFGNPASLNLSTHRLDEAIRFA
jgi:gamma-glutamyltranspeptidase/glutathione hydrolase